MDREFMGQQYRDINMIIPFSFIKSPVAGGTPDATAGINILNFVNIPVVGLLNGKNRYQGLNAYDQLMTVDYDGTHWNALWESWGGKYWNTIVSRTSVTTSLQYPWLLPNIGDWTVTKGS